MVNLTSKLGIVPLSAISRRISSRLLRLPSVCTGQRPDDGQNNLDNNRSLLPWASPVEAALSKPAQRFRDADVGEDRHFCYAKFTGAGTLTAGMAAQ